MIYVSSEYAGLFALKVAYAKYKICSEVWVLFVYNMQVFAKQSYEYTISQSEFHSTNFAMLKIPRVINPKIFICLLLTTLILKLTYCVHILTY